MSWRYRVVFTILFSLLLNYLILGFYTRAALVSIIFLFLWCWKNSGLFESSGTSSYGLSREVVTHVSGERKVYKIYPFCPSELDFRRKFEDELAVFLYLLGTRFAQPRLHRLHKEVEFHNDDGSQQYSLDFRWLLKHFAYNSSKYALLLTSTPTHQKELEKLGKINCSEPANLVLELNDWQNTIHINTIASFADFLHTTCTRLCKFSSNTTHGSYLTDTADGRYTAGGSSAVILDFMQDGLTLAKIITILTKPRDFQELDEHYQMMVNIKETFKRDFLPWIDLVNKNDAAFSKLSASEKEKFIRSGLERMAKVQEEKSKEVLAVTTFSQFGIECK